MKSQIEKKSREIKSLFETSTVSITIAQGSIYFSIWDNRKEDREEMAIVKAKAVKWIMENDDRKWLHAKSRGYRVWWWGGNQTRNMGLRCGIKTKLTDAEHQAVVAGPDAWRAIQEK